LPDARQALQQGLKIDVAKSNPELAQQMYFDLGGILETEGALRPAAEAFAQAVKILEHPDHMLEGGVVTREMVASRIAEVYERIGHLYRKAKQYDQAIEAFKIAQARFPTVAGRISFNLAQVYLDKNDPAQALTALDAYLRF